VLLTASEVETNNAQVDVRLLPRQGVQCPSWPVLWTKLDGTGFQPLHAGPACSQLSGEEAESLQLDSNWCSWNSVGID
jgi:hypothetical protein